VNYAQLGNNMKDIFDKILCSEIRIGVIGDSMIDEYYNVSVKKISPEFPIPVMHSNSSSPVAILPGGAANVAYQLGGFNSKTYLCSFIDSESESTLQEHNIDTSICVNIDPFRVPRKKRFYNGDFPTYRWDVERDCYGMDCATLKMAATKLADKISSENFDVLIFSDYDKGVFNSLLMSDLASKHLCPIRIVDPKRDLLKWKGCTLVKPNSSEAKLLTGMLSRKDQIDSIIDTTDCQSVVITNEGFGFYGKDNDFFSFENPKTPTFVNSVIGAGDCFVAFLGLCLGSGINLKDAAEFAFAMGSLYVTDKHNKPISIDGAKKLVFGSKSKIVDYQVLEKRNFSLVVTNGCFDILHSGHMESLEFAKKQGDKLLVAVNSDESVSKLKFGRPVNKLEHRMRMVAGLECVDYVCSFSDDTPRQLMDCLKPDVLVKGRDYIGKEVIGGDVSKKVVYAPMVGGISTTAIIDHIKAMNV